MTGAGTGGVRYWDEEPAATPGRARIRARIGGLHCSLCTGTIERALGRRPGVDKVAVSLTHEQALIEYDPRVTGPVDLLGTLKEIGYTIWDPRKLRSFDEEEADLVRERKRLWIATLLSVLTLVLMLLESSLGASRALAALLGAVAFATVFVLANHILVMAWQSLRRGILNQHVMVEATAFAGLTGGVVGVVAPASRFPAAGFFAVAVLAETYHIFSEWLSLIVKTRSSQSVKRLLDLQPDTARLVTDEGETHVAIEEVGVGAHVRVRPGERVPVDGEVVAGRSAVDEALVTGESVPVEKGVGASVVGGSINGSGTLLVAVTATGSESFLSRVIRHVEDARALKPGILHLVDKVLRVYAPAVLALAGASLLFWTAAGDDVERGVFAALGVLVMGYPCAVGIAAPLAIVRGAGIAAEHGILMRTGEAFQTFRQVRDLVLDKTGTLTEGRFAVREVEGFDDDDDEILRLAGSAEAASEHPVGEAVVGAALERGLLPAGAEDFTAVPGRGVSARVDGRDVLAGSRRFLREAGVDAEAVAERVARLEELGRTVVLVAVDGVARGLIALGDELRADAASAVAAFRDAGLRPILVTGDNELAARRLARQVGIERVHAGVLPEEKAEIVRELQKGGRVAMVGDGINDAPALMQADVGIALGAGTDIAIDSSDVIILGDRLESILAAREISGRSYRKTRQNVLLAFLFNGIGVPLATTGLVYPVWAMAAMVASVTSVFANSLWGRLSTLTDAVRSVGKARGRSAAVEARA